MKKDIEATANFIIEAGKADGDWFWGEPTDDEAMTCIENYWPDAQDLTDEEIVALTRQLIPLLEDEFHNQTETIAAAVQGRSLRELEEALEDEFTIPPVRQAIMEAIASRNTTPANHSSPSLAALAAEIAAQDIQGGDWPQHFLNCHRTDVIQELYATHGDLAKSEVLELYSELEALADAQILEDDGRGHTSA
jgi:hypothetical protein